MVILMKKRRVMWGWGVVELFILFLYTIQRKKYFFQCFQNCQSHNVYVYGLWPNRGPVTQFPVFKMASREFCGAWNVQSCGRSAESNSSCITVWHLVSSMPRLSSDLRFQRGTHLPVALMIQKNLNFINC